MNVAVVDSFGASESRQKGLLAAEGTTKVRPAIGVLHPRDRGDGPFYRRSRPCLIPTGLRGIDSLA